MSRAPTCARRGMRSTSSPACAWPKSPSRVPVDLILLDLGLPDGDGVEWLSRQQGLQTPVLILTARDQISQRIRGLDAGADDYLTKPYDLHELAARVRAMGLRQIGHAGAAGDWAGWASTSRRGASASTTPKCD